MKPSSAIEWDKDAEEDLSRVPFLLRPLVRRKLEERVLASGAGRVTLAIMQEAEARFRSVMAGKSPGELDKMAPRPNEPGVEMVIVDTCHNELTNCPNVLVKTGVFAQAFEEWTARNSISERLRALVREDTIKFHHKLRISISGCPNACSRPQIADIGVVGSVQPIFGPAGCVECAACEEACPDGAIRCADGRPSFDLAVCQGCKRCTTACPSDCISLLAPRARVLAGGKLGRHPRFAEFVAEARDPAEVMAIAAPIILDYIGNAGAQERFADYWVRAKLLGRQYTQELS